MESFTGNFCRKVNMSKELKMILVKGYLHYEMITSQNVSSELYTC